MKTLCRWFICVETSFSLLCSNSDASTNGTSDSAVVLAQNDAVSRFPRSFCGSYLVTRIYDRDSDKFFYALTPGDDGFCLDEMLALAPKFTTIADAIGFVDKNTSEKDGDLIVDLQFEFVRKESRRNPPPPEYLLFRGDRFVQVLSQNDWDELQSARQSGSLDQYARTRRHGTPKDIRRDDYLLQSEREQLIELLNTSSNALSPSCVSCIKVFLSYYDDSNPSRDFAETVILSPAAFDFGEVTEIERPVLTATLRNNGERTVHVTDVIRTCVCANLELSATNLPPGGAAEVRCTLDPNVFSGPFLKTFFIKTDDPATPSITVPIRGSVRQLWEVSPDKWYQMRAGETNAVLRVKAAPDAPALVRSEILGPAGASFELRPAGEREFEAVFAPGDQPRGQHHWTVNLYPEGAETPALGLHLGAQVGEHWKCVPARLRAPVNGRDFVADLLVKPANGKDLPADVDPAAITLSPVWDHVSIEPLGPPTWRGIPLRLTVGAEMVSSWEFPKTFYLTIPGHGVASVYFEKIVPATEPETEQTGETK